MLQNTLASFYERDLRKLIEEINKFKNEEDLWKIHGSIRNPAGNLVLHIAGGLNSLIGDALAHTGYVRNRDEEFSKKDVKSVDLVSQLEMLIPLITHTLNNFSEADMEKEYPRFFDRAGTSVSYVLIQLLAHLNYHLGQVNYLRRALYSDALE